MNDTTELRENNRQMTDLQKEIYEAIKMSGVNKGLSGGWIVEAVKPQIDAVESLIDSKVHNAKVQLVGELRESLNKETYNSEVYGFDHAHGWHLRQGEVYHQLSRVLDYLKGDQQALVDEEGKEDI